MKQTNHVALQLSRHLVEILHLLSEIDGHLVEIDRQERLELADTPEINNILPNLIVQRRDLVRGAGIAYGTDDSGAKRLWMDWWDTGPTSILEFKEHNFSHNSWQFYDYHSRDWYVGALKNAGVYAAGPYLDTGGTEAMVITVAMLSASKRYMNTVVAADIRPDTLERLMLAVTSPGDRTMALINAKHEIVASTGRSLDYGHIALGSDDDVYLSVPGVLGTWAVTILND